MTDAKWFEDVGIVPADIAQSTMLAAEQLATRFSERRAALLNAAEVALDELERAKTLEKKLRILAEQSETRARKAEELLSEVQHAVKALLAEWINAQDNKLSRAA